MTLKSHSVWACLIGVVCGVFGVSSSSAAHDNDHDEGARAYPGVGCQVLLQPAPPGIDVEPSGFFNFTHSLPNPLVEIVCPIVRTRVNTNAGVRVDVTVRRAGPNPTSVRCSLLVESTDGTMVLGEDDGTVDLVGGPSEVIHLRVQQSPPKSYFVLECELPPDFGIVQYVVREE
jgi:hypothetical protein